MPEAFTAGVFRFGEEDFVLFEDEEGVFFDWDDFFAGLFEREFFGLLSLTEGGDGAGKAGRFPRAADGLAELHEGGIEEARAGPVENLIGPGPELFRSGASVDGSGEVEEAGEDAGDIPIDDGGGTIEGEGADGAGGVGSDARKLAEFGGVLGEGAGVV